MTRKTLEKQDLLSIIRRIAEKRNEYWVVKKPLVTFRTKIGRHSFSEWVCRLWSVLGDEDKTQNLKQKKERDILSNRLKELDTRWVLWGVRRMTEETDASGNNQDFLEGEDREDLEERVINDTVDGAVNRRVHLGRDQLGLLPREVIS